MEVVCETEVDQGEREMVDGDGWREVIEGG